MIPAVDEILISSSPWDIVFTTKSEGEKGNKVYEILYVKEGKENVKAELIKSFGKPIKGTEKQCRRIVILEDETRASDFPYLGINFVCKLTDNKIGYDVIEKRTKEIYRDYE